MDSREFIILILKDAGYKLISLSILLYGYIYNISFAQNLYIGLSIFTLSVTLLTFIGLIILLAIPASDENVAVTNAKLVLQKLSHYRKSMYGTFSLKVYPICLIVFLVGAGWWFTAFITLSTTIIARLIQIPIKIIAER